MKQKQKIVRGVTVGMKMLVAMLLSLVSLAVHAYDFEVDGIYYTITSMSDLEVEVTYSQFTEKYVNGKSYFGTFSGNTTPYTGHVSIPSTVNYQNRTFTVVGIGKTAFGCDVSETKIVDEPVFSALSTAVTSVSLPTSIRYIDERAFQCCKIESIEIPSSVQTIGVAAFANTSLKYVYLPASVTQIGKRAFYGSSLGYVVLGSGVKTVNTEAFSKCSYLMEVFCTSATVPTGLSLSTFANAHSALEVYVPSVANYGFGKAYLTFPENSYPYSGSIHTIEWTNNLKAYKCEIAEAECKTQVNAGSYTQNLKATYSNGVNFTVEIPYSYTISKAPLTLTVNDTQKEYGDANPEFTCVMSGFVNGENEQNIGSTPTYECEATRLSKVGTYRILASLNATNYDITYKYGTLTVVKAPITVNVAEATKQYGDANPTFSMTYTGLKNGETEPTWTIKPTFSTSVTKTSSAGTYAVTAAGGEATNYEVTTYVPGTLTVTKRDLTVTADSYERYYGEENPTFTISYSGFVNGEGKSALKTLPTAQCTTTKDSNAGTYAITVSGGSADNYNFTYQNGKLTIKPISVGFANTKSTVTYKDMSISTNDVYFNYVPEISGPYSADDFYLELWFLDGDNRYSNHVATITGGDYAGKYVNTNSDRVMYAGKYIFNLKSKGTNPNVTVGESRAYVTVEPTSTHLSWNSSVTIRVPIGQTVDLGITYQADLWCSFTTTFDEGYFTLSVKDKTGSDPHWYATGVKEGNTRLYFSIECNKNEMGFYNFSNSNKLSRYIKVVEDSGVEDVIDDQMPVTFMVYNLQGVLVLNTEDAEAVNRLPKGLYIVNGKKMLIQ